MVWSGGQTMTAEVVFGVLLTLFSVGTADAPQSAGAIRTTGGTIRLSVVAYPPIDAAAVTLAKTIAAELLASAGLQSEWHDEDDGNGAGARSPVRVVVHLLPFRKATRPEMSGEVVQDARTHAPSVLVYVPGVSDLVRAIRISSAGRSTPTLATVELGHLVGLTIAHEVGHILGLAHTSSGVMKANPGLDDVQKLRASRLNFRPTEVVHMREAMIALASHPLAERQ
jgi:hypothetical protein